MPAREEHCDEKARAKIAMNATTGKKYLQLCKPKGSATRGSIGSKTCSVLATNVKTEQIFATARDKKAPQKAI